MRRKLQDLAATVINVVWFGLILWGLFSFYNWADREKAKDYAAYQQETQREAESYSSPVRSNDKPEPPNRDFYADKDAAAKEMMATDEAAQAIDFADLYSDPCPYTNTGSNLRAGPSTSYPIIGYASQDSCIPVDGRNSAGTWYSFQDESEFGPGVTVWIWAELVENAPDVLPVIFASATPAPQQATSQDDYQDYLDTAATEAAIDARADLEWWESEKATLEADGILEPDCASGCTTYPTWCDSVIKANVSYDSGEKIYHAPGQEYYDATVINTSYGERWFCTEDEARAAGWRKAQR